MKLKRYYVLAMLAYSTECKLDSRIPSEKSSAEIHLNTDADFQNSVRQPITLYGISKYENAIKFCFTILTVIRSSPFVVATLYKVNV